MGENRDLEILLDAAHMLDPRYAIPFKDFVTATSVQIAVRRRRPGAERQDPPTRITTALRTLSEAAAEIIIALGDADEDEFDDLEAKYLVAALGQFYGEATILMSNSRLRRGYVPKDVD